MKKMKEKILSIVLSLAMVLTLAIGMGPMEAKAEEGDTFISSINVQVDWSKIPNLVAGSATAPNLTERPATVVGEGVANYGCGWAIKIDESFKTDDPSYNEAIDGYIRNYQGWTMLEMVLECDPTYRINAEDTYALFVYMYAGNGYTFGNTIGEQYTGQVTTNVQFAGGIPDQDGMVTFFKLGTLAEMEQEKEEAGVPTTPSTPGANGFIDRIDVQVDWTKVPDLVLGSGDTPSFGSNPATVTAQGIANVNYGWAVKVDNSFKTDDENYNQQIDHFIANYGGWAMLNMVTDMDPNYRINTNDTYAFWASFMAEEGYNFGEETGVPYTGTITSNVDVVATVSDGFGMVSFYKLGTLEEMQQTKEDLGIPTTPINPSNPGSNGFIDEITVTVDWAKVPWLREGSYSAPYFEENPATVVAEGILDVNYGWAIKVDESFKTNNQSYNAELDNYINNYDGWAPIGVVFSGDPSYSINTNDTYAFWASLLAADGYNFGEETGVPYTGTITSNVDLVATISDGFGMVSFYKLGTLAEMEQEKEEAGIAPPPRVADISDEITVKKIGEGIYEISGIEEEDGYVWGYYLHRAGEGQTVEATVAGLLAKHTAEEAGVWGTELRHLWAPDNEWGLAKYYVYGMFEDYLSSERWVEVSEYDIIEIFKLDAEERCNIYEVAVIALPETVSKGTVVESATINVGNEDPFAALVDGETLPNLPQDQFSITGTLSDDTALSVAESYYEWRYREKGTEEWNYCSNTDVVDTETYEYGIICMGYIERGYFVEEDVLETFSISRVDVAVDSILVMEARRPYDAIEVYLVPHVHVHSLTQVPASEATCTVPGNYAYYVCTTDNCTEVFEDAAGTTPTTVAAKTIAALGHDWSGEWTTIKDATETETGKKETYCENGCGQKKVALIPATGAADEGSIEKDAEVAPDAPIDEVTLNNTATELVENSNIFNPQEVADIENGVVDARVWLEIKNAPIDELEDDQKDKMEDAAEDIMGANVNITYFDATLYKQVGSGERIPVSEPGVDIDITIKIPTELINTNASIKREYKILRLHEGQNYPDVIEGTFDAATGEFSFVTNKFSVYAIVYEDTVVGGGSQGGGNQGGTTGGTTGGNTPTPDNNVVADKKDEVPKTGDVNTTMYAFLVMLVSGVALLVAKKKES